MKIRHKMISKSSPILPMRKFLVFTSLLTTTLLQLPMPALSKSKSPEARVVCYYTNWSAYRQGPAKFLPDNINPYLCTHLIYAFGGLTSDSGIKPFDKYQDFDKGGYTKFNGLKTYNNALKTLLAIGGWNEGSGRFSRLVADPEGRKSFIKNSIRFLRQHNFDGLDLDWEYPAAREGGEPEDKKNYAAFIKELREAFEEESEATDRTRLLLTIAVPAGIEWIQKGFDIPTINRNVDFFNLLTYDFHASTEPAANHHAPLKPKDGFSDYDYKSQLNIEYAINYYLDEGADADKLVVGLPTYGRSYTLFNPDNTGVGAPASGPGTKGKYTKEPGYLAYYEICEGIKSGEWRVENGESDTQGPHAVKDNQWVGYDDTRIMAIKAKWVKEQKLGGIMFWSIDNDDFRGYCDGKAYPLIEAAKLAYLTGQNQETKQNPKRPGNTRFSTGAKRATTTPTPPKTTTIAATSNRKKLTKKVTTPRPRRRRVKSKTTPRTTTTTQVPVTHNPLNTPPPPTTPETSVDFECKDDGFFGHPKDCKKYFWCLDAPGLGLVAHHFTCPAGLFFNKNTDSCDYSRNVPCKPGGTTTTTTATTTTTTTTTTTPSPQEEYEYYDEEEEEVDEAEEEPEPEHKKAEVKVTPTKVKSSPKSAHDVEDIRKLLRIIRKLGGVEELEKYLEANPDVADEVEEFEDEEEAEIPARSTTTVKPKVVLPKNRFNSLAASKKFTPGTPRPYTSIQRDRVTKSESPVVATTEKATTLSKYVTLSRGKKTKSDVPSSITETSIVVRYSNEEKLLEESTTLAPKSVTYVTSAPYSKVTGDGEMAASEEKPKPKYSTFTRLKISSTSPIPESNLKVSGNEKVKERDVEAEEEDDDTVEEDYAADEPVHSSTTTLVPTTSSTTEIPTQVFKHRAPARTRPKFKALTSTSTTSTDATTKVTFRPSINLSNRRNALLERRRGTSTSTTQVTVQPDEKESSSASNALAVTQKKTFKETSRSQRPLSTTTPSPIPETPTRFHSRFRTSTQIVPRDSFDDFFRQKPLTTVGPFSTAGNRRRTRKPLTIVTSSPLTTTSTTTTTTTNKPALVTLDPKVGHVVPIPDSNDYYYYVYEDDDLLDKAQSQSAPSTTFSRRNLDLGIVKEEKKTDEPKTVVPLSDKVQILSNGSIECRDTGIYSHPKSCGRSYIRCIENENGTGIKAWVYACPKSLTFDAIGSMCNWATTHTSNSKECRDFT